MRLRPHRLSGHPQLAQAHRRAARPRSHGLAPDRAGDRGVSDFKRMDAAFELGLYTFGDLMPETQAGKAVGAQQRLAEILNAAKLADAAGLDVFAVGEHHRLDM